MKKLIEIENPWGTSVLQGYLLPEKWNGFRFLSCVCSVVAMKDGKAVTQCVTLNGAKRRLRFLFFLPNIQDHER